MARPVTNFEAGLLDSCLRRHQAQRLLSVKQQECLARMVEDYFGDLRLAAEIRGQQRLFG